MKRVDLHCHSHFSDGTCSPSEVLRLAQRANIELFALTDHDTMAGVAEAMAAGREAGIAVLPALEMDTEWAVEMHILGLDVDPLSAPLQAALDTARARRDHRNAEILKKLREMGLSIDEEMARFTRREKGSVSRLHIAQALVAAGHAESIRDAFSRLLSPGMPAHYAEARFSPREVIDFIRAAGGIPVLAHPCQLRDNPHETIAKLVDWGIEGLEAYYPASTQGQTVLFESLARQYHLLVTCGSDFHGKNREGTPLGCAWREVPCLIEARDRLLERHRARENP